MIEISLSKKAINHIKRIVKTIPDYKNWIKDQINSCFENFNVISKVVDFDNYILCIISAIETFLNESNFNYDDSVLSFGDHILLEKLDSDKKINYDLIIIVCFLNCLKAETAIPLIKKILVDFKKKPIKFNKTKLMYHLYLWEKNDIDDVQLIQKILDYYVKLLENSKIKTFELEQFDLEELQDNFEQLIFNRLKINS